MPIAGGRSIFEYFFLVHLYDTGSAVVNGQHAFRALGGISQSWTLVVEISFYMFLPFYAALLRTAREPAATVTPGSGSSSRCSPCSTRSASCGARSCTAACPRTRRFGFLGNYWLPANLDVFALGMGLAVVRVWADGRATNGRRCSRRSAGSTGCGGCWPRCASRRCRSGSACPTKFVLVYGRQGVREGAALQPHGVLPARCRRCSARRIAACTRRFLQLGPMVYLGTISYGIYLWHQAFIEKMHQWGGWSDNPLPNGPFLEHVIPRARADDRGRVAELVSRGAADAARCKDRPLFGRRPPQPGRGADVPRRERDRARVIARSPGRVRRAARGRRARDRRAARHVGNGRGRGHRRGPLLRPARRGRHDLLRDLGVPALPPVRRRRTSASATRSRCGAFWWRRGLRIFPAYWVALTAAILLLPHHGAARLLGLRPALPARADLPTQVRARRHRAHVDARGGALVLRRAAGLRVGAADASRGGRPSRAGSPPSSRRALLLYAFGLAWHIGVVTTRSTDAVSARWLPAMSDWFALGILLAVVRSAADVSAVAAAIRQARRPVRRRRGRARARAVRGRVQHRAAGRRDERHRAARTSRARCCSGWSRCCSSRRPRSGLTHRGVGDARARQPGRGRGRHGLVRDLPVALPVDRPAPHVGRVRLVPLGAHDVGAGDDARALARDRGARAGSSWSGRCCAARTGSAVRPRFHRPAAMAS